MSEPAWDGRPFERTDSHKGRDIGHSTRECRPCPSPSARRGPHFHERAENTLSCSHHREHGARAPGGQSAACLRELTSSAAAMQVAVGLQVGEQRRRQAMAHRLLLQCAHRARVQGQGEGRAAPLVWRVPRGLLRRRGEGEAARGRREAPGRRGQGGQQYG